MPYALIPVGYTLKKVNKQQQDAVNRHRRHENVEALITNPEIIKQIILVGAGYLALKEAKDLFDWLEAQGQKVPQALKEEYKKKRAVRDAPVGVSFEEVWNYAKKEFSPFE
jgi:anion-transporting  ArsA/GET3 family ATPase